MILFFAEYPTNFNNRDGMFQRVSSIDSHFADKERTYLRVSVFGNRRKIMDKRGLLTLYTLNFFLHFSIVYRLITSASLIYIHSLYNIRRCTIPLLYLSKAPITLDLHGVVPEEELYMGNKKRSKFFTSIERSIFGRQNLTIVTVTDSMRRYYHNKYPKSKFSSVKYSIFPSHLTRDKVYSKDSLEKYVNIVYAGNLQKWQNTELMLEYISKIITIDHYRFYILTGEIENMTTLIEKHIGNHKNLQVLSVAPEELEKYYERAHYGFVLRDDIIVNQVACPTKLVEYMHYGLTPIVLSENVGDFYAMGFEYVKLDQLHLLTARKSKINMEIIDKIKAENKSKNFESFLS